MKKILTSNGKILTENGKILTANVESGGGGIVEVEELPEVGEEDVVYKLLGSAKGTTVPSGKLSTIYFNNNLTTEEVVSIIESANLGYSTDGPVPNSYLIAQCLMIIKNENTYGIMYIHSDGEGSADFNNIEAIFISANAEGVDFVGWNPNFKNPIVYEYNNDIESNDTAISKNEALKDLVSSTPFGGESDYYIYEGDEPTQVPNSGWIENLYFNTSLSVEEVDNILSQLTFNDSGEYMIMVYQNVDGTYGSVGVLEANKVTQGQISSGYMIYNLPNASGSISSMEVIYTSSEDIVAFAESVGLSATVGWNKDNLSVSQEAIDDGNGLENDKLINVVSTTPYPHWTKISGGGATVKATPIAVPNSGYVERIYLNKSLSFDEVNALVEKANSLVANETLKVNCILSTKDNSKVLTVLKFTNTDDSTFNVILYPDWLTVIWSEKDYTSPDGTMTCKKGWNIEQNYLEINAEVVAISEDDIPTNCGAYNDQLTELFSANGTFVSEMKLDGEYDGTTIFLSNKIVSESTVVPNSGYVDMVYYNYNLTIEETNNILSQLTYIQTPLHQKPIAGLLLTENEMGVIVVDWGDGYEFLYLPDLTGSAWVTLFNSSATTNTSLDGWNSFEETEEAYRLLGTFEANVLSDYNGIPVGAENDKLINLIGITPFEVKTVNNFNIDIKSMLEEKKLPLAINVNVEPNLQEKEITENGEYVADEGYDGFSKVTVNVAGEDMLQARVDATNSCEYLFYQYKGDNVDFIKDLDTSNVTNMSSMFNGCSMLETIPQLDMIKVSTVIKMFYNCSKLTNLTLLNIKAQIDLSQNEKLTLESLINTVKEFINAGNARILTMGTANLSKIASTYVKFTDSSVTSIPKNEKGDVVVCESTDTGAMLLKDYALLKNWTLA